MSRKVIVLGAGISGLSTAAYLAKLGFKVEILEKYSIPGGRARKLEAQGFRFDMGTAFYGLPNVYERFFNDFNYHTSDFFNLIQLNPGYRIFFDNDEIIDVPSKTEQLFDLFENIEKGSSKKLERLLKKAEKKQLISLNKSFQKQDLLLIDFLKGVMPYLNLKIGKFQYDFVGKKFRDKRLFSILKLSGIFMGAIPCGNSHPFDFVGFANLAQGIWYPDGGIFNVLEAIEKICYELGVEISYQVNVDQLDVMKQRVSAAHSGYRNYYADYFVSTTDYSFTDQKLIQNKFQNYSQNFWNKKSITSSTLIFYLGLNKKLPNLLHNNLLFDGDINLYLKDLYINKKWPENPLMFVSVPSKTNFSIAPEGCENLVISIPVATGLEDHGKIREYYFDMIISRLEKLCKTSVRNHIVFHKSYAHSDFVREYNALKGNSFGVGSYSGLRIQNRHLSNLFYTEYQSIPGQNVLSSISNGKVVANLVFKESGGLKS